MKLKKIFIYILFIIFLCTFIVNKSHSIKLPENIESITLIDINNNIIIKKNVILQKNKISKFINYLKNSTFTANSESSFPNKINFKIVIFKLKEGYTISSIYKNYDEIYFEQPFYGIFKINYDFDIDKLSDKSCILNTKINDINDLLQTEHIKNKE